MPCSPRCKMTTRCTFACRPELLSAIQVSSLPRLTLKEPNILFSGVWSRISVQTSTICSLRQVVFVVRACLRLRSSAGLLIEVDRADRKHKRPMSGYLHYIVTCVCTQWHEMACPGLAFVKEATEWFLHAPWCRTHVWHDCEPE